MILGLNLPLNKSQAKLQSGACLDELKLHFREIPDHNSAISKPQSDESAVVAPGNAANVLRLAA